VANLDVLGGALYFTAYTTTGGYQVYQTGGTAAGTVADTSLATGGSSVPANFATLGTSLFFTAPGASLWQLQPPTPAPTPTPPTTTATAAFVKTDAATQGGWSGTYGAQGYDIVRGPSSLPAYAAVTPSAAARPYTWAATTTDPRALQVPGASGRLAACWHSTTSFSVDVNLSDGQAHGLELYLLDWDQISRAETVQLSDAATGAVLSTQSVASFHNGLYLDYRVSGHVVITITCTGGPNAVLSGLFLDPASSTTAAFVKQDTATQGTWAGTYGAQGYDLVNGPASLPSSAAVTPSAAGARTTWAASTADPRALKVPGASGRLAACWHSTTSFSVDVNLSDGQAHGLELYLLDWDSTTRAETVTIRDAATGAVLSTQSVASFHGGVYLDYQVSGHVAITITRTGGANAVLSGLFLN
jgi:ELWxxDGT repeat protein